MGEDESKPPIEDKVAAELAHVLAADGRPRPPAAQHQPQIVSERARLEKRGPAAALQAEMGISFVRWRIGKPQVCPRLLPEFHAATKFRAALADGDKFAAGSADVAEAALHLAEVRQAGDSGQVP